MQKLLLSAAVIAASGMYVVVENHAAGLPTTDQAGGATALPTAFATSPAASNGQSQNPAPQPAAVALPVSTNPAPTSPPASTAASPLPAAQAAANANSTVQVAQSPAPASDTDTVDVAQPPASDTDIADAAPAAASDAVRVADATVPQLTESSAPVADVAPVPLPRPAIQAAPTATAMQVAQTTTSSSTGFHDGTYKGPAVDAYYGYVQVAAVIKNGQLASVKVLQYPHDRSYSRRLSSYALPRLEQEAVQAQSANVDTVSRATATSEGFIRSLGPALASAQR